MDGRVLSIRRKISLVRVLILVVYGTALFLAGMAYEHYTSAAMPTISIKPQCENVPSGASRGIGA
jgi:hypothetical protein